MVLVIAFPNENMNLQQRELLQELRDSFQKELIEKGCLASVEGLWEAEPYIEPFELPLALKGVSIFATNDLT
jgi:hypothetical protein